MTAIVALALSIVLTLLSQLAQKQVANDVQRSPQHDGSTFALYVASPMFWFAMVCLGFALLAWLVVLSQLDVSKAYPLLSLNYVLVLVASRLVFHERIPPLRWFGVLVICSGIAVIAVT